MMEIDGLYTERIVLLDKNYKVPEESLMIKQNMGETKYRYKDKILYDPVPFIKSIAH